MKVRLGEVSARAEELLPPERPDGSGVGVNYVDAYVQALKATLEDGRKVLCTRRGLKLTLKVGDAKGEGLLRRLEHGPDPREILRHALAEAADAAGVVLTQEDRAVYLSQPRN